jgi:hypothetical protein
MIQAKIKQHPFGVLFFYGGEIRHYDITFVSQ